MSSNDRPEQWPEAAERLANSLAAGFPELGLDFAPASLERLEAEVLRRFAEPEQLAASEARPFVDGVAAYFGQVMCSAWGSWGWTSGWTCEQSPWEGDDRPEINLWKELYYAGAEDLEGFVPWDVIAHAVRTRSGDEFLDRYADFDNAAMNMVDDLASADAEE